jgi:hypothetical protein
MAVVVVTAARLLYTCAQPAATTAVEPAKKKAQERAENRSLLIGASIRRKTSIYPAVAVDRLCLVMFTLAADLISSHIDSNAKWLSSIGHMRRYIALGINGYLTD